MALKGNSSLKTVKGIKQEQKQRIRDFIQGAVYCWCKNQKDKWFSMRDLMGGDNSNWEGTPLQDLYSKHRNLGKRHSKSYIGAAIDAGWLLKAVLVDDTTRAFEQERRYRTNSYRWIS